MANNMFDYKYKMKNVLYCLCAIAALLIPVCINAQNITPDDGGVYLMKDESVRLDVDQDPDPGTPPESLDCGCDENYNIIDPVSYIATQWTGDTIGEEDPANVRLDTDGEGDKYVYADFYVQWKCPGDTPPASTDYTGDWLSEITASYRVVCPRVTKVTFNNGLVLTNYWSGVTVNAGDTTWEQPLGEASATKDECAAYIKGSTANVEPFIEATEALSNSITAEVRGTGSKVNFPSKNANFHYWQWNRGELTLDSGSSLYKSVNFYDGMDINWQYRVPKADGSNGEWVDMNTSYHRVYTTYAASGLSPLYNFALELVTSSDYAANESSPSGIAASCSLGVNQHNTYAPTRVDDSANPLTHLDPKNGAQRWDCDANSRTLKYLLDSIGVSPSSVVWIWGGNNSATISHALDGGDWWNSVKFVGFPKNDEASADPGFLYHAVLGFSGIYYDPSYGSQGELPSPHTAPAGVPVFSTPSGPPHVPIFTSGPATSRQTGASLPDGENYYWGNL